MSDLRSELQKLVAEKPNLRKTLTQRVWTWLKDHPDKTTRHVAASMHEDATAISRTLFQLKLRGMVIGYKAANSKRDYLWCCASLPHMGAFELQPRKKPEAKVAKPCTEAPEKKANENMSTWVKAEQGIRQHTPEESAQALVNTLPLDMAHRVYLKLKTYFDPKVL